MNSDFFHQSTPVVMRDAGRVETLTESMDFKHRHLHVGCADAPIFDPETNLHYRWLKEGFEIDGYDPAQDELAIMSGTWPDADFYSHLTSLKKGEYHLLMIPDVIEHVGDVEEFLREMEWIEAYAFALSTPNGMSMHSYVHEGVAYEEIHPDHNFWFTPYTIVNTIHKYTSWQVSEVVLVEDQKQMVIRGLC